MKQGDKIELLKGGEITVKTFRETDNGIIVVAEDGNIYTEDELNIRYKLAPAYILYRVLHEHNVDLDEYDKDLYSKMFEGFMREMERSGYIKAEE